MLARNFLLIIFPSFCYDYLIVFLKYFFFLKKQPKLLQKSRTASNIFSFNKSFVEVLSFSFSIKSIFENISFVLFVDKLVVYALYGIENSLNFFKTNTRINIRLLQSDIGLYNIVSSNSSTKSATYFLYGLKSI